MKRFLAISVKDNILRKYVPNNSCRSCKNLQLLERSLFNIITKFLREILIFTFIFLFLILATLFNFYESLHLFITQAAGHFYREKYGVVCEIFFYFLGSFEPILSLAKGKTIGQPSKTYLTARKSKPILVANNFLLIVNYLLKLNKKKEIDCTTDFLWKPMWLRFILKSDINNIFHGTRQKAKTKPFLYYLQ